ncbi:uncharacterized protein PAC_12337 [Phialocephala subalpina]|uniref:Rhodopsin domain-containing protein n=1 Tax=Phialocephala subalpina TaxID=576137 RepID=A0A1L7XBL0_9HELO|nr:uncharacterized protein PAC_12337 [Phialocephala subalpina]
MSSGLTLTGSNNGLLHYQHLADARYLWIRHVYDIPVDAVPTRLKMILGAQLAFALACTLTKLSMLSLSGGSYPVQRSSGDEPPQDYWKVTKDPQPNCINQASFLLAAGIINTLTDFLAVIMPIQTVWVLQLPTRQALIVMLLFAFGFISCGAGIARTYYMWQICASIPATKPFFTLYLPQLFNSSTSPQAEHTAKTQKRLQKRPRMEIVTFHAHNDETISFEKVSEEFETRDICESFMDVDGWVQVTSLLTIILSISDS